MCRCVGLSSHTEPVSGDVDDLLCESIDAGSVKEERGR